MELIATWQSARSPGCAAVLVWHLDRCLAELGKLHVVDHPHPGRGHLGLPLPPVRCLAGSPTVRQLVAEPSQCLHVAVRQKLRQPAGSTSAGLIPPLLISSGSESTTPATKPPTWSAELLRPNDWHQLRRTPPCFRSAVAVVYRCWRAWLSLHGSCRCLEGVPVARCIRRRSLLQLAARPEGLLIGHQLRPEP